MMRQQNCIPRTTYDEDADVLYLKYASNKNATAREIGPNIIAYFDDLTGEPTTITIIDFKWLEESDRSWRDVLPIYIDFDKDVIPFL